MLYSADEAFRCDDEVYGVGCSCSHIMLKHATLSASDLRLGADRCIQLVVFLWPQSLKVTNVPRDTALWEDI